MINGINHMKAYKWFFILLLQIQYIIIHSYVTHKAFLFEVCNIRVKYHRIVLCIHLITK